MRWIALILLVAVIAVAAALYGMVTGEGEAGPGASVAAGGASSAGKVVHQVPDWGAALDRHTPPKPASTVAFTDGKGQPVSLADFKGRGVVVNLWATWCSPCVREMPSLNRLQASVADAGIRVIAVSSDREGLAKVGPFLAEHKLDRLEPYLDANGAFTRSFGGRGLPQTFLINADGKIVASYTGPAEWDDASLIAAVRELAR
jgi:thiol-disulfide isomerase/thioredoxin